MRNLKMRWVGMVVLALAPLCLYAEDPPPAAAANAVVAAPAASATANEEAAGDHKNVYKLSVGAVDASAGKTEEDKGHGLTITIDPDDAADQQSVDVADKVAAGVFGGLHNALKNLPEDVRAGLDDQERHDLDAAISEIEQLKKSGGKTHHVIHDHDDAEMGGIMVGALSVFLIFGGPIIVVAIISYNNRRKRQMVHQTIDRLIEQGKDVPVELLDALDKGGSGKSSLARGTVNIALGVGIGAALGTLSGWEVATLGLIPFCIGVAQLMVWKLDNKTPRTGTITTG